MNEYIDICQQRFDTAIRYFAFAYPFSEISDMHELRKLALFPQLQEASFSHTNLDDVGLSYLSQCPLLDNLDLQATQISDAGLRHLQRLPRLRYLRLKENWQLTNAAIASLNGCQALTELQIHETSIDQQGLAALHIDSLRHLLLQRDDERYSFDFLQNYSTKHPKCLILVKGNGEFVGGKFVGKWQ